MQNQSYTEPGFYSTPQGVVSPVDTSLEIDEAQLKQAVKHYFPKGYGVDDTRYMALSGEFYASLSLGERGDLWGFLDRTALDIAVPAATSEVRSRAISACPATRRMLIIGCGDGRLCETYIRLADRLGYVEITFNDLFEFHIDEIKKRVAATKYNRNTLKVSFIAGDFTTASLDGYYDISVAMFFVTSEILALSSLHALNEKRSAFFRAVRNGLHPCGIFIEDTPEMTWPGFYHELRRASASAMSHIHGLGAEAKNFTLTALNKPQGGFPYHIRYMPERHRHYEERLANGFRPLDNWTIPASIENTKLERWKRIALWAM